LNERGYEQARAARDQLRNIHLTAVYTSDLLRSIQTAARIAEPHGLPVALEPRLREIKLGAWEGMLSDDIKVQYPREMEARAKDPFHARAPDGESPAELVERVHRAVNEITGRDPYGSILIVGHGLSLAVIICLALGIPMAQLYENIPENGEPCSVVWGRTGSSK
jgi:broad specificity phosphatase PhoE